MHKINIFLSSRNLFTFMFEGKFQLNVHKITWRKKGKEIRLFTFCTHVYQEWLVEMHQFISRLKRAIIINTLLNSLVQFTSKKCWSCSFLCRPTLLYFLRERREQGKSSVTSLPKMWQMQTSQEVHVVKGVITNYLIHEIFEIEGERRQQAIWQERNN